MRTVTLEEAQNHLAEILEKLPPGGEVAVIRGGRAVATIRLTAPVAFEAPELGTLKGTIRYIAPDFDAIPEGFEDYLP